MCVIFPQRTKAAAEDIKTEREINSFKIKAGKRSMVTISTKIITNSDGFKVGRKKKKRVTLGSRKDFIRLRRTL